MDNFLKYNLLIFLMIGFVSCDLDFVGFIDSTSDGVDKRTEFSLAKNEETGVKKLISPQEEYQLCMVGDTHIGTTVNLAIVEAAVRNSSLAILNLGDITTGRERDYQTTVDFFSNSATEIIPVLGNHDLYFDGWRHYKRDLGSSVFYFEVQTPTAKDLHICLDSGNGTLGRKQYNWLKNTLASKRGDYRHCFVYFHVNLFRTDNSQFVSNNMPLEETYQLMDLFGKNKVNAVFMAHDHYREELVFNNIQYVTLDVLWDGVKNASYVVLTVNTNFRYHFVDL